MTDSPDEANDTGEPIERAIVTGPDSHDIGGALEDRGITVARIQGVVTAERLREAGIEAAGLLVVTDLEEATAIPVARELRPELRIAAYDERSLPEFVSAVTDFAIDPELLSPEVVAEELL